MVILGTGGAASRHWYGERVRAIGASPKAAWTHKLTGTLSPAWAPSAALATRREGSEVSSFWSLHTRRADSMVGAWRT
eukprot:scaffold70171_cov22-Tisochrysis_lutea.AAC.2